MQVCKLWESFEWEAQKRGSDRWALCALIWYVQPAFFSLKWAKTLTCTLQLSCIAHMVAMALSRNTSAPISSHVQESKHKGWYYAVISTVLCFLAIEKKNLQIFSQPNFSTVNTFPQMSTAIKKTFFPRKDCAKKTPKTAMVHKHNAIVGAKPTPARVFAQSPSS